MLSGICGWDRSPLPFSQACTPTHHAAGGRRKATHQIESRGSGCPVSAMCLHCPLLAKFNMTPAAQAITVNTPEVQIWNRKLVSGPTLKAVLAYTIRTCLNKQTSRFPSQSTKQRKRVTSKPVLNRLQHKFCNIRVSTPVKF